MYVGGWGRERGTDREQETEVHVVQVCVCVDLPRLVTEFYMCICTHVCMFFCLWYHAGMCLYVVYFCVL